MLSVFSSNFSFSNLDPYNNCNLKELQDWVLKKFFEIYDPVFDNAVSLETIMKAEEVLQIYETRSDHCLFSDTSNNFMQALLQTRAARILSAVRENAEMLSLYSDHPQYIPQKAKQAALIGRAIDLYETLPERSRPFPYEILIGQSKQSFQKRARFFIKDYIGLCYQQANISYDAQDVEAFEEALTLWNYVAQDKVLNLKKVCHADPEQIINLRQHFWKEKVSRDWKEIRPNYPDSLKKNFSFLPLFPSTVRKVFRILHQIEGWEKAFPAISFPYEEIFGMSRVTWEEGWSQLMQVMITHYPRQFPGLKKLQALGIIKPPGPNFS